MERKKSIKEIIVPLVIYIIFAVGIVGHMSAEHLPLMLKLTPYTLLFCCVLVFFSLANSSDGKIMLWIILTFTFTFVIEVLGVKTGKIFGQYFYGDVLGFAISGVPLIIGFNWVFIILGALAISDKLFGNNLLIILSTSVISVAFDIILEPNAIKYGYWNWAENIIPIQNYISWFLIAVIVVFIYIRYHIKINTNIPMHYFIAQTFFFLSLLFWG